MTGLTAEEFTTLLPHVERALAAYLQDRTIRLFQYLLVGIVPWSIL
jgi:hypothetical protein